SSAIRTTGVTGARRRARLESGAGPATASSSASRSRRPEGLRCRTVSDLVGCALVKRPRTRPTEADWIEEMVRCMELLESIVAAHSAPSVLALDLRVRFLPAAGRIARPDPVSRRRLARAFRRRERDHRRRADEAVLEPTRMRTLRRPPAYPTPLPDPP